MAAIFSNKFTVQCHTDGIVRIIFTDERASIDLKTPAYQSLAGEFIMTNDNAEALAELIIKLLKG